MKKRKGRGDETDEDAESGSEEDDDGEAEEEEDDEGEEQGEEERSPTARKGSPAPAQQQASRTRAPIHPAP